MWWRDSRRDIAYLSTERDQWSQRYFVHLVSLELDYIHWAGYCVLMHYTLALEFDFAVGDAWLHMQWDSNLGSRSCWQTFFRSKWYNSIAYFKMGLLTFATVMSGYWPSNTPTLTTGVGAWTSKLRVKKNTGAIIVSDLWEEDYSDWGCGSCADGCNNNFCTALDGLRLK